MPDENHQNLSNLSSSISYLLFETLEKSQTMEDLKFAYFFKIKDPCKIFFKENMQEGCSDILLGPDDNIRAVGRSENLGVPVVIRWA